MTTSNSAYLEKLLSIVAKENASDLHVTVGRHPTIRVEGTLTPLVKEDVVAPEASQEFVFSLITEEQKKEFLAAKELDLAYNFRDRARFRVNIFFQRGFMGAALRLIPSKMRSFEELSLPPILKELCTRPQGFFLVVGPTGHGKSTTLAAMVEYVNKTEAKHIITIEDPIEYLFASDRSIIDQREVGIDTADFHRPLRSMFREDVDVAMIGEMRDAETIATAVTAAETGHLILSTLHTNNAAQTIDRIIDSFAPEQQNQIRLQLSSTLIGIMSQRLIPRLSGGLVPAAEVLIVTPAVRNLIREGRTYEIDMVIETGSEEGMISLNRALADLVRKGEISMENALIFSLQPDELRTLLVK